jgi:hypothetical protein
MKSGANVNGKSNSVKPIIFVATKTKPMVALPLSILAFAAGVYLLIKVKTQYLSGLFSVLAWLVIAASLVSLVFASIECVEDCCEDMCGGGRECRIEKKMIIRDGDEENFHHMKGECSMEGCHMEGDSCVFDKAVCEKMIGKEACDAMCKERGRCIMSKEECMKMGSGCSMHHAEGMMKEGKSGCCMEKEAGPAKGCCKEKK